MPTKTDRILSYLPDTFRVLPRPSALYSVADAFGNELLLAENSLAAVMLAHWVDHADRGAEFVDDLARIAALYGLAPRGDEDVEEFREHLKRYVRTFLEGTVTAQGILRVTAEALGLRIADAYADMDTWWTRSGDALVTVEPSGSDAAGLLFGVDAAVVTGRPLQAASITGTVDLSAGVDLRGASVLRLKVDAGMPVDMDLAPHIGDLSAATLPEIEDAINTLLGVTIASHDGRYLTLTSPTEGSASRLEAQDIPGDAVPRLLGLPPRQYQGMAASAAKMTGTADLRAGVDLSEMRYLRLVVDGAYIAEIDCAGASPAATTVNEVVEKINAALGIAVATHDGYSLTLTSPSTGFTSSITLQPPAAQDATEQLFGAVERFHIGRDAQPATAMGNKDLGHGVDLSSRSRVRIQVGDLAAVTVNCAGANPAQTRVSEIIAALNASLGPGLASHDGRFVRLVSPSAGPASNLAFEPLPADEDATEIIFGIGARICNGGSATHARLAGATDLSAGVNLWGHHVLRVGLDGNAPREVDLWQGAPDPHAATLDEIATALNVALGSGAATHDGQHLILVSPTVGTASRITLEPVTVTRRRRFVSRAFITDEATQAIFGFIRREAQGTFATPARIIGSVDINRGVDLRQGSFLRIGLDGLPPRDIDCAARSPRPRAAMPEEIVAAINAAFGYDIASYDGRRLVLTSPSTGAGSRIAFELSRGADALDELLGHAPAVFRGQDATSVQFTGTPDLSGGIDLGAVDKIKIGVDGAPAVEITCTGNDPVRVTLNEIVMAINVALGAVIARHDGKHLILASPSTGTGSRIAFEMPAGSDATHALFGISPPRYYHGSDAIKARVTGIKDLSAGTGPDLGVVRFLRIAHDGQAAKDIDCAARAADPAHATLDEITAAINEVLGPSMATHDGKHLVLFSSVAGGGARLELLPYTAGDARSRLLGTIPEVTTGSDPAPAVITGETDLLTPVNLGERRILRLSVDGGRAMDIDVAGAAPAMTFLDEIVNRINAVFPGLASATEDDRLRLISPTAGEASHLEVLPLRALELIEYPPTPAAYPPAGDPPHTLRHSDRWVVNNEGAANAELEIEFIAPHGTVGPAFASLATGQCVRIETVILPGQRVRLWRNFEGELHAEIIAIDGVVYSVSASHIVTDPPVQGLGDSATLMLPRGRSGWIYLDCHAARFDDARFNRARFSGGLCLERAVFDISHFVRTPPEYEAAVFAPESLSDPPVEIRFHWAHHQPGALVVNLPADLPERFGGRFDQVRFALADDAPESYAGVVAEPLTDPNHLETRINASSHLIEVEVVPRAPIGWQAVTIPFRRPRVYTLTGGRDGAQARLYLAEKDVPGIIELRARQPGEWGNGIAVSVRKAGSARFDVTVNYEGARFESARKIVFAGRLLEPDEVALPALIEDLLKPNPIGVVHAKAAGIRVDVSRDNTQFERMDE